MTELPSAEAGTGVWMQGDYKLHKVVTGSAVSYRLYDVVADPAEMIDLAGELPDVVAEMAAALSTWQTAVWADLNS